MVTANRLEHSSCRPMFHFLKMFCSLSCHDFGRVCCFFFFFAFEFRFVEKSKSVKIIREEDDKCSKSIIYLT